MLTVPVMVPASCAKAGVATVRQRAAAMARNMDVSSGFRRAIVAP
jgi:hypothetical protein